MNPNERTEKCMDYLASAGSIPAAVKLAHKDGFSVNTMVWIGALGKMLPAISALRAASRKRKKVSRG